MLNENDQKRFNSLFPEIVQHINSQFLRKIPNNNLFQAKNFNHLRQLDVNCGRLKGSVYQQINSTSLPKQPLISSIEFC